MSAAGMPHFELYHFLCQFRAGHANHCRDYVTMFSGKQMLFIALSLQYSFNSVKTKEEFKDFFVNFFNIEKPTITNVLPFIKRPTQDLPLTKNVPRKKHLHKTTHVRSSSGKKTYDARSIFTKRPTQDLPLTKNAPMQEASSQNVPRKIFLLQKTSQARIFFWHKRPLL